MAITPSQTQDIQAGIDNANRLANLATRQNAADIAAGQKQTYQPQPINTPAGTPLVATGTVASPATITASSLTPTAPIDYKTPNPPQPESINNLTQAVAPAQPPLSPIETQADTNTQRLLDINNALLGKGEFTRQQQTMQGIPEKNQAIADLTQQFNDLQKKETVIKTEYGGSLAAQHGVLEPFVTGERDARLRQNAVEALTISSSIDAANGLLASAQRKVDLAVQQKYGPLEEELKIKKDNLDIISKSPTLTRAEKDRALAREKELKQQEIIIAQKKQEQTDIWNTSVTASQNIQSFRPTTQYPTSAVAIKAIQNAKTKNQALQISIDTGLTKPPTAQSDFEQAFLRDKGRLPNVSELLAYKTQQAIAGRNPAAKTTIQERTAQAVSKFSNAFVPGAKLKDGTEIIGADGYTNPIVWKQAIKDAPAEGLTRAQFIKEFGHLVNPQDIKSYGLTPVELKLISPPQ